MISKKLIKALLGAATKERKDSIIEELLNHISISYDYNDQKAGHLLEMLVDSSAVVEPDDVNLKFFDNNLNRLMYKHEDYNIKDIKVKAIDNIDCFIQFEYKYIEKINEERDDVTYTTGSSTISYLDFPDVLKNVK